VKITNPFRGVSGVALGAFLIIILSLSIYFFVSIYQNEHNLQQRGFNVLNELSRAIKEQDLTLQRLGRSLISKELGKKFTEKGFSTAKIDTIIKSYKDSLARRSDFFRSTSLRKNASISLLSFPIENIPASCEEKDFQISYTAFLNPLLRKDPFSHYVLIERKKIQSTEKEKSSIKTERIGTNTINVIVNPNEKKEQQEVNKEDLVFNTFPFSIELAELSVSEAIKKPIPTQSFGIIHGNADSINNTSTILQAGTIRQISIQGKEYEMFIVPLKFNSKEYYLGGFIEDNTYLAMKRGLDTTTVFIFILVLGTIILSFPLLKILLMGPFERLTRFSLTLGGISFVAGVIVVVVLTTDAYIIFQSKTNIQKNLKCLSKSISDSFYKESEDLLEQMKTYNKLITANQGTTKKAILSKKDTIFYPNRTQNFKTFFWVDSSDNQIMQLSTRVNEGPLTPLHDREYVKNYSKWSWVDAHQKTLFWYNMEPIYSNTTGEWLLAFSTKSNNGNKKAKLMAITSEMYSLKDPIIPYDYEYCIVDADGKVWFHSTNKLYIKEDFVEACNQNQRLATAIRLGVSDSLTTKLHGKTYFLNVSPLNNTQLYLVTMCNPFGVKLITAQACSFAFFSLISIFIFLVLLYLSIKIVDYRSSKLVGKNYFLSWLMLNKNNNEKYGGLIISNIFIALGLIIFALGKIYENLAPIHVVLISASIIVSSFFFAFYNLKPDDLNEQNKSNKRIIYYSLLVIIWGIIDFFGFRLNGIDISLGIVVISQLILILIYLLVRKLNPFSKLKPLKNIQSYIPFLFSWLFIAAIIPSFLIVKKTFKNEYNTYISKQQVSIAQQINARTEKTYKFYNESLKVNDKDIIEKRLECGKYISFFDGTFCNTDSNDGNSNKPLNWNTIFNLYFYKLFGVKDDLQINPQIIKRVEKDTPSVGFNNYRCNDNKDKNNDSRFIITSDTNFGNFNPFKKQGFSLIFWLLALFIIVTIYFLLRFLSKKLFHFDIQEYQPNNLKECLKLLSKNKLSGVIVDLYYDENRYTKSYKFINISNINFKIPALNTDEQLLIIGFDSNIEYANLFNTKIKRLEALLDIDPPIQIVVVLYTDPKSLIDEYAESWKLSDDKDYHKILIYNFEKVFSHLPVFYCKGSVKQELKNDFGIHQFTVLQELSFESHLMSLEPIVFKYYDNECKNYNANCRDFLILKIQELAQPYYTLLWNRLSFSERFVLFDLAQDGVVNVQNEKILKSLICKGLIQCHNGVTITSEGFKNFILTTADKVELEKRMQKILILGNWHRFKGPLLFVAFSIAVFLIATQLSFLSNLSTILISAGSLLTVFLKFGGLFDTTGGKEKA